MNLTKIEWTDLTWNVCVGCDHGCAYCYAKKLARRIPCMKAGIWIKKISGKQKMESYRLGVPWRALDGSSFAHCKRFEIR